MDIPAQTLRLRSGSTVGPYEIEGLIGTGAAGEVYRASDPRADRAVALKIVPPGFAATPEYFARFAQEARTGALLNHPNIVTVYDVGTHDGMPFVASELLDGDTLRARLRNGRLAVASALNYARQIGEGLSAAHQLGVVHRDLKPENIFVTRFERVKILDFGLAKNPDEALEVLNDGSPRRRADTLAGAVGYLSPEQIRGLELDDRSDLFSLGVILYEMIAGVHPFLRKSATETLSAILGEDPPPIPDHRRVPAELERVIRHCLEKDREDRFQSVRDLLFNLDLAASAPLERHRSQLPGARTIVSALLASLFQML